MTYLYPYKRGTGWRSQGFRSRPNQGSNGPGGHTGFDQAMAAGQPLYAPADGIIRNSGWLSDNYRDNGWWLTRMGGDTLVIDCTDSFGRSDRLPTFIFAHCSDTMAEVGQFVRKGQLVALSGNTGTATTGPHVHIEALPPSWDFNNGVYGRVDPELYFDEWIDDYVQGGIAAMGDYLEEKELVPNATDKVFISKDGSSVSLQDILNSMDGKVDGIPEFLKAFKLLNDDLRADLLVKRHQINSLTATVNTLAGLVASDQDLNPDQIKQAVAEAIADGITLTVKAGQ